ncbi:hypothetical protein Aph01nite_10170 [Acrocarpospora phusangensis]|uniref:Uncharacterized protein n=1 Tax=Acrocarpospora phusangensis TaxID=1070424 RepID=A0A919QAA8_9ACTN|nr:hypothetical protein [Acrocarpospora phusangensis]GIH22707.1 hypothetical protein Aph01nite_10170 [Acrocarpospora phusangensis]
MANPKKKGAAARLGKAVAQGAGASPQRAGQAEELVKFLAVTRLVIEGPACDVRRLPLPDVAAGVARVLDRGGLDRVRIRYGGGPMSASGALIRVGVEPEAYVTTAVTRLLEAIPDIEPDLPLRAVMGDNPKGGRKNWPSEPERMLRLVEAVVAAAVQAELNLLDAYRQLAPEMIRNTARFVRAHFTRNGWEHGAAFELIWPGVLDRLPLRLPAIHQTKLPALTLKHDVFSPKDGYDTVLDHPNFVFPYQYKAVQCARKELIGEPRPSNLRKSNADVNCSASFMEQRVGDGIRNLAWGHWVPGPAVPKADRVRNKRTYGPPGNTAGWKRVSRVGAVTLHTDYLLEAAWRKLSAAFARYGGDQMNVYEALEADEMRTQIVGILGGPNVYSDMPPWEFRDMGRAWLDGCLPGWQDEMNELLHGVRGHTQHPDGPLEVRLIASHQRDRLIAVLTEFDLLDPSVTP